MIDGLSPETKGIILRNIWIVDKAKSQLTDEEKKALYHLDQELEKVVKIINLSNLPEEDVERLSQEVEKKLIDEIPNAEKAVEKFNYAFELYAELA